METQGNFLTAIQRFNVNTGGILTLILDKTLKINDKKNIAPNKGFDALAEIKTGKAKIRFKVIIKNEIREMHIPAIAETTGLAKEDWLLICQYIPEPVKIQLQKQGINYLEAAGNCFIRRGELFIFINDQPVTNYRVPKEGKLWKPAGLKFLFAILQEPEQLNETYRNLMKVANIAIGNIGPLLEELKEEGYTREGEKNGKKILFLENKELLQEKWVELFDALLRPKLKLGKFRFLNDTKGEPFAWKKIELKGAYWGGEPAGANLTDFLQPEEYTIYIGRPKTEIMKELRLVPDPHGNIELMDLFWDEAFYKDKYHPATVPPLLAYAELITSLDSRNRETAERIKTRYLG